MEAQTFCVNWGFCARFELFPGVDGMGVAWNRVRIESGRRAGKAGEILGVVFMGSRFFGSVSIVRREGDIFGKRWIATFDSFKGGSQCGSLANSRFRSRRCAVHSDSISTVPIAPVA